VRIGKGKLKEVIESNVEEITLDGLSEVISEEITLFINKYGVKEFTRRLLECCPLDCLASILVEVDSDEE